MCFSVANKRYQYVVPFIVIDVKWLHNDGNNHFAYLTDNTYGHVYEDQEHKYSHMNPIEPYIKLSKGNEEYFNQKVEEGNYSSQMNTAIMNHILGNTGDKIVSMRLFDKQYDEAEPNWWKDIQEMMTKMTERDYNIYRNNKLKCEHEGKIVKYE